MNANKISKICHCLFSGSKLGLEAEKAANPSSSSTKDLGPCGKQRLLPLRENNPEHNEHHHNDNNDHNNDNNNDNHQAANDKSDNKSSTKAGPAHDHLSSSFHLHCPHTKVQTTNIIWALNLADMGYI